MYNVINKLLTPNQWSRPQKALTLIKAIVIHWVANPMSTATGNRDYFESRKSGTLDYGSAHEVVDLNGDIVVCVPENEITYNCGSATYTQRCLNELGGSPNYCTYGIECTHTDWNGLMTSATYNTLVERCADLCIKFKLNPLLNLWTHQEVVGWKDCHRWFVNNPNEWALFKQRVADLMVTKITPQWMIDGFNYLYTAGFVKSPNHTVYEIVTMGTFASMINNYTDKFTTIEPISYLCKCGFFSLKPDGTPAYNHLATEQITINTFASMYKNRLKDFSIEDPIQFLTVKGFIGSAKNPVDLVTMGLIGAMFKNAITKGTKI
jgi:N-acetylmuramoyl-L-alanine amidase